MPNIVIKIEVFSEIDDLFANYVIKYKKTFYKTIILVSKRNMTVCLLFSL
jgi:hypothetical protein